MSGGATASLPAHLILVGLPGAGKTTHGRRAARALRRPFIDLDRRIVHLDGRAIARIFAEDGEPAFRDLERTATAALAIEPPSIVAPGGGWIMNPANVELVKPGAQIVWLQVSPKVALQRMGGRVSLRPLLANGNPLRNLEQLLAKRRDRYAMADAVINTELLDWQGVVNALAALATPNVAG